MLGAIYMTPEARDEDKAIESYRKAYRSAPSNMKDAVLTRVPPKYHAMVRGP
jgi:cytochrome c-type biogenesis protein CcmH/NrfG